MHRRSEQSKEELENSTGQNANIFKKYGLEFCCNTMDGGSLENEFIEITGNLSKLNAHKLVVLDELLPSSNLEKIKTLLAYIEDGLHYHISRSIPIILEVAQKVARVHGQEYPQLADITRLLIELRGEWTQHILKEEKLFFRHIRTIVDERESEKTIPVISGTVNTMMEGLNKEHIVMERIIEDIRELANGYSPEEGCCNSNKILYAKLNEIDIYLHHCIQLETCILFPKVLELSVESQATKQR